MARPEGTIKVGIVGATGRMGVEVARSLHRAKGIEVVLAVDRCGAGERLVEHAGPEAPDLVVQEQLAKALDAAEPHVLVDFTHAGCAPDHALTALQRGVAPIVGTSGLHRDDLDEIAMSAREHETPALVVPNFALGAVLMMKFCEMAARWMPDVEIVEMHHDAKLDAPSGTARRTAEMIATVRDKRSCPPRSEAAVPGVLGGDVLGVPTHSVRMKGLVAHQMVLFGAPGETLMIRHDSLDRTSFMPGVELCVRRVWALDGLVLGLDNLLV